MSDYIATSTVQGLFAHPLCFGRRVHFDSPAGPTTSATHGTVFGYLGPEESLFVDVFSQFGTVMKRIDPATRTDIDASAARDSVAACER